jgi:tRNA nucleotidyltransferase/poly(A) polymerase
MDLPQQFMDEVNQDIALDLLETANNNFASFKIEANNLASDQKAAIAQYFGRLKFWVELPAAEQRAAAWDKSKDTIAKVYQSALKDEGSSSTANSINRLKKWFAK